MATGGSGYLGRALTQIAAAAGWAVTATRHSTPGPARLDVCDRARVRALLDTLRPAAVVHTAYVQQDCRLDSTLSRGALRTRLRGVRDVLAPPR